MASNEYNIDDKYTIVVEEQDTFQLELNKQGPQGERGPIGPIGPQGDKGEKGDQGIQGEVGPKGDTGVSVVGVEEISKVGLVATYRMEFSNGEYFDYQVTDGSIDGLTRETIISIIGYEPASYTSVEGLTTRVSTLEGRFTDIQTTLYNKQDKLTAGENITIVDNVISAKGGGSGLEICDIGTALYVDETKGLRRRLNGQIVDINTNTQAFLNRLQQITTLHPSLLCTETEWQTAKTSSAFGQVGKFVFNYSGDDIVSVRLPRVVNVQGLFDLQNLGMTVGAGLPNITGSLVAGGTGEVIHPSAVASGAFKIERTSNSKISYSGSGGNANLYFDASDSNPIYGKSNTVQQEAIKYPYFIQIATGSETENNIVNDIELNNPYSLFDSKYSDHELNNLSWLKSEGQWNAKAVYTDAYNKLLKVYNGTKTVEGLSVKLSTETYTDYDFVLNTSDETFRLPLLNGDESLPSAKKYIYKLPTSGGQQYTALYNGIIQLNATSSAPNQYVSLINTTTGEYDEMRAPISYVSNVCNIQVKAGDTFTVNGDNISTIKWLANIKYVGNGSLYYYVGETVQNANLIDAGRIGEQLAGKVDTSNTQWATNACIPDYSAVITISYPFTCPSDGFITHASQNSGEQKLYINNNPVWQKESTSSVYGYGFCLPVSKNDVITQSGLNDPTNTRFIPLKGAK